MWIESQDCRRRLFREEADQLLAALKHLQPQDDGMLGDDVASGMMRCFVPDIVANLRTASGSCEAEFSTAPEPATGGSGAGAAADTE